MTRAASLCGHRLGSEVGSLARGSLGAAGRENVPVARVRVVTVDEMAEELELEHIDYLKIDTEG